MFKLPLRKPKPYKMDGHSKNRFPWSSCAPFVDNNKAMLIHRPREVSTFNLHKTSHIAITFWCGNSASGENKFTFLEVPPLNKLLCTRCEDAALAAALPSADDLAGQHIHKGKLFVVKTCCEDKK
jgi:hypothetical protein